VLTPQKLDVGVTRAIDAIEDAFAEFIKDEAHVFLSETVMLEDDADDRAIRERFRRGLAVAIDARAEMLAEVTDAFSK
jgi:hypothetical protein